MPTNIKRESSPEDAGFNEFARNLEKFKAREKNKPERKREPDTWHIGKRKRYFLYTPTGNMKSLMKKHQAEISSIFDSSANDKDCWLNPSPPEHTDGTARNGLTKSYTWRDELNRLHVYQPNFGIITCILKKGLSEDEIAGIIDEAWQASHRCGNRTCLNWRHFKIEPGHYNRSRNLCLLPRFRRRFRRPCPHFPPCMTKYTRKLQLTQSIRNAIYNCVVTVDSFPALDPDVVDIVDKVSTCYRFDMCSICKKHHLLAPFCSMLDNAKNCWALLVALRTLQEPTEQVKEVIGWLEDLKGDLELGKELCDR